MVRDLPCWKPIWLPEWTLPSQAWATLGCLLRANQWAPYPPSLADLMVTSPPFKPKD
jgi:hypothetical protein